MKKYFTIVSLAVSVSVLAACGSGSDVVSEDSVVEDCIESGCEVAVSITVPETDGDDQPAADVPTVDTSTVSVPEGTRLLTDSDIVDNSIPLPDGFRFNVSRITDVVGEFAITASGPGYTERSYVVYDEVVFDESIDPLANDTADLAWCTTGYGFAKLYINTDGPEMYDDYITLTCEGGRYNTPQFDYHYVSAADFFSLHGYLGANSASALITINPRMMPHHRGTLCVQIMSTDATGEYLGFQEGHCLVGLDGRDRISETFPLPITRFGGESIEVRLHLCAQYDFDHDGNCFGDQSVVDYTMMPITLH